MRTLSGLLSDGPLILYFYPRISRRLHEEACSFRDLHQDLPQGTVAWWVSARRTPTRIADSPRSTTSTSRCLSDPGKKVIKAYRTRWPARHRRAARDLF